MCVLTLLAICAPCDCNLICMPRMKFIRFQVSMIDGFVWCVDFGLGFDSVVRFAAAADVIAVLIINNKRNYHVWLEEISKQSKWNTTICVMNMQAKYKIAVYFISTQQQLNWARLRAHVIIMYAVFFSLLLLRLRPLLLLLIVHLFIYFSSLLIFRIVSATWFHWHRFLYCAFEWTKQNMKSCMHLMF